MKAVTKETSVIQFSTVTFIFCLFLGSEGGGSDNPGLPCMFP